MANQEIMCTVSSCHYWAQGNRCDANQILITSNEMAESLDDSFDAPQATTAQQTEVSVCVDTCCKTFVYRDAAEIEDDGVYRV